MSPCQLQLIRHSTNTPLDQRQLPSRIHPLPLLGKAPRPPLIIHRRINQSRRNPSGHRRGGVVHGAHDKDVLGLRARDLDFQCLVIRVVERLDEGVNFVVQSSSGAFEDEVERGLEAGLAEGAVAAVGKGDLVEVLEDVLEPAGVVRVCFGSARLELAYYASVLMSASSLSGVRMLLVATAVDQKRSEATAVQGGFILP